MPCNNSDHKHRPWPVGVEQVLVIEACETECGWCKYHTKSANNLRVHARRHVANENEPSLYKIIILKGKAGRKNVQMERRQTPALQAYHGDLEQPSALGSLESLPRQARAPRLGDDMAYVTDRPGFFRPQSQHGSGMSISPSHPSQQPMSIPLWEAKPINYPATCRFDKIWLKLIQDLVPFNCTGVLLDLQSQSLEFPLTAAIVSNIIYIFTVDSLPEQIAIMYIMCFIIRWIITGSKEDYYSMPSWLRPGAAQIVTAHPAWVDMMPWPELRNRLCCNAQYHDKYEAFKNAYNETISINWPFEAADTLIRLSPGRFVVNPVFIGHLRLNSNWTLGPSFLATYLDFKNDVNIGQPRVARKS